MNVEEQVCNQNIYSDWGVRQNQDTKDPPGTSDTISIFGSADQLGSGGTHLAYHFLASPSIPPAGRHKETNHSIPTTKKKKQEEEEDNNSNNMVFVTVVSQ